MGCIATINNGAEGIKLLENRVQLEACIEYNDVSTTGCPDHGVLRSPPLVIRNNLSHCSVVLSKRFVSEKIMRALLRATVAA